MAEQVAQEKTSDSFIFVNLPGEEEVQTGAAEICSNVLGEN